MGKVTKADDTTADADAEAEVTEPVAEVVAAPVEATEAPAVVEKKVEAVAQPAPTSDDAAKAKPAVAVKSAWGSKKSFVEIVKTPKSAAAVATSPTNQTTEEEEST